MSFCIISCVLLCVFPCTMMLIVELCALLEKRESVCIFVYAAFVRIKLMMMMMMMMITLYWHM